MCQSGILRRCCGFSRALFLSSDDFATPMTHRLEILMATVRISRKSFWLPPATSPLASFYRTNLCLKQNDLYVKTRRGEHGVRPLQDLLPTSLDKIGVDLWTSQQLAH